MTEQFSLQVCRALNDLGFNEKLRQYRIDKYGEENFVKSLFSDRIATQHILSGSKAEGTSKLNESDFDLLDVLSGVKATEHENLVQGDNDLVFLMEEDSAPPGYCKLQLLQCGWNNWWHQAFLGYHCYVRCPGQWRLHLSSSAVVQLDHVILPFECVKSGPSNKGQRSGSRDTDHIQAIRCTQMPLSFKNWIRRHQDHKWIRKQIMEEIARSDIFVVPVGMHGTERRDLQWRVSFNIPEKILIHNFTSVQYKIYVLLKMIKTEIIEPHCPQSVTSYIVKTLMLWAVEEIPERLWSERKLIDLLFYMLHMLYKCVKCGFCPMYFISECNILHGRVTKTTQQVICDILCALMSDRISCILTLPSELTKLNEYVFLPMVFREHIGHLIYEFVLAFRWFNGQRMEKTDIAMNIARNVYGACLSATERNFIISFYQGQVRTPYEDFLADLVAVPTPVGSDRKKLVKYAFNQTLSQLALQQFVDTSILNGRNIDKYRRLKKCMKILHGNCSNDPLSGKIELAQVLCKVGQYEAAQDLLMRGADRIRYYMHQGSGRWLMQKRLCVQKLINVCENECLSTFQILKKFFLSDIHYDHQMELCLPKALQYETYLQGRFQRRRTLNIDPETALYYFQYLCYEQLGQKSHANVAFTNLVW